MVAGMNILTICFKEVDRNNQIYGKKRQKKQLKKIEFALHVEIFNIYSKLGAAINLICLTECHQYIMRKETL